MIRRRLSRLLRALADRLDPPSNVSAPLPVDEFLARLQVERERQLEITRKLAELRPTTYSRKLKAVK